MLDEQPGPLCVRGGEGMGVWEGMFSFLLVVYLGVEWLGQKVTLCPTI